MQSVEFLGLAGEKAYIRTLTVADVDNCVRVESAFPEQERCSRDKVSHEPPQLL